MTTPSNVSSISVEYELRQSYLDYAMSVIVGRALPDVRDGLKPVHRRVLYAMRELGNEWNKPYKKSARIVGDVIGKYHPHGDTAVYDAIVRMAQDFSMRYLLIDGQGNFGSVDGDSAAAMRYTEIRMTRLSASLLSDLDKDTVDFVPNYDNSETSPAVMPSRVPNLLINGSSGIAVGMATNIPPHNLTEVVSACIAYIENAEISIDELMEHIRGPDFPTAGIINGRGGIIEAYRTGRGKIYVRAKSHVEEMGSDKQAIIVDELPYQVNKARLLEKIAELVKEKKIESISALRDESDKQGMRMVIELKRGENAEVVLNKLYKLTNLQTVFGINMVALDKGRPRLLNLKQCIEAFVSHRRDVVTRRTRYELRKARQRAHLLEGLSLALSNIDLMIALIKAAKNPAEAKEALLGQGWSPGQVMSLLDESGAHSRPEQLSEEYGYLDGLYHLSPDQAQAILDLKLHRLTGLEQEKIISEYREMLALINACIEILSNSARLLEVIHEELKEVRNRFGDERRTDILENFQDLSYEDMIANDAVVVTVSNLGYCKVQTVDTYSAQRRGGRGKSATVVKEEDFVKYLHVANMHDTLLCFSSKGRLYWLKVYQLPLAGRGSRGKPIINLLPLDEGEVISAILPVQKDQVDGYLFMATAKGVVKKVDLEKFSRPRPSGIIALDLMEGDRLVSVDITSGDQHIMLFSNAGKVVRFKETNVRPTGRTARGVRGIRLKEGQRLIAMIAAKADGGCILTASENGFGKQSTLDGFRIAARGGQGVISMQVNERNGQVVGACQVLPDDEILMITDQGTLVRTRVNEISVVGRNTQGVKLINLNKNELMIGLQKVNEVDGADEESSEDPTGDAAKIGDQADAESEDFEAE